ncbi:E-selectin-like [Strongylocentrotus purpuratus]|uniref:Sushi domain-containing protein n=1 Tax=Strongylocentrotus purpuratus TaxID=7668 RepID=A0A7M7NDK0_STRPU|nr:E-selectin-like [Strongylocentrotus purpuratus]
MCGLIDVEMLVQRETRETLNMSVLGSKLSPITIVLISVLLSGQLFVGVTGQCGSVCSPPLIFGDGTPSFSPDEECYDGGSNVNVTCSGYLFGVTEIGECVEATPSGYWVTYPLPTCEESSCPLPTAPQNGLVSPVNHNSLYDEIIFSCDDGLFLDGPGMAVCIGTGQWSPTTVPTCSANCPSPDIANSDFATNQSETDHGDFIIVTVTCDDGFTSGTGDNVSEPLTCGNGSWDVDVYCYSNCPLISAPDDGYANSLVEPFYHGRIVAFNCSLGFTLVGNSSSTCDDGNWLNAVPECKANCPLISAPDDGYANSLIEPFYHGRIIAFNCSLGFTLVGNSSSTCDDGNWLNAVPECKANCPLISAPDDGYANSLIEPFYHGRIIAFNCSLGFTLVGDSSSTCDDGNWLNAVPECIGLESSPFF